MTDERSPPPARVAARESAKARRLADPAIDRGHLAAVVPHMKVVAALDRYHGLSVLAAPLTEALAAAASLSPSAPPQFTRAAPALAEAAIFWRANRRKRKQHSWTGFGA